MIWAEVPKLRGLVWARGRATLALMIAAMPSHRRLCHNDSKPPWGGWARPAAIRFKWIGRAALSSILNRCSNHLSPGLIDAGWAEIPRRRGPHSVGRWSPGSLCHTYIPRGAFIQWPVYYSMAMAGRPVATNGTMHGRGCQTHYFNTVRAAGSPRSRSGRQSIRSQ